MNNDLIPLPKAVFCKEYTVKAIIGEENCHRCFKGYGIIPGASVTPLFPSPCGNPCAYEVAGAVIALRHEDSGHILVMPASYR
ncbi:MAG: FeoA family protein [Bacillota bacterium]|nr:FeoA family protein [Bacillota bacterium]